MRLSDHVAGKERRTIVFAVSLLILDAVRIHDDARFAIYNCALDWKVVVCYALNMRANLDTATC